MLCECGQREATVHEVVIRQGKKTERHLCEQCARAAGLVLSAQPGMLANSNSSFLIELLLEYARLEPERLYRACAALLDVVGGAVGDIRSAHSFAASYIVDAAAALHQIDEENRARAVDLIERMTALGVEEASDFLRSFDGTRDAKPRSPTPRRRRRRRHRRPRAVRRSR